MEVENGQFKYSNVLDFDINDVPGSYNLYQNFPNPFNPNTRIEFEMKGKGFVTLSIYDILGEKVKELVNSEFPRGKHILDFDAAGFLSGVYVYNLNVKDQFSETKKMTLLR